MLLWLEDFSKYAFGSVRREIALGKTAASSESVASSKSGLVVHAVSVYCNYLQWSWPENREYPAIAPRQWDETTGALTISVFRPTLAYWDSLISQGYCASRSQLISHAIAHYRDLSEAKEAKLLELSEQIEQFSPQQIEKFVQAQYVQSSR